MKDRITKIIMSFAIVFSAVFVPTLLSPDLASAAAGVASPKDRACEGVKAAGGGQCDGDRFSEFLKEIVNILLFIVGTISVIMIIVGGLRYALSGGDSNSVTAGKNTVLYAIIGLVVSIMAFAIVNFVIGSF